jgi:hypothetical protein
MNVEPIDLLWLIPLVLMVLCAVAGCIFARKARGFCGMSGCCAAGGGCRSVKEGAGPAERGGGAVPRC